jgi:hypothetical protein
MAKCLYSRWDVFSASRGRTKASSWWSVCLVRICHVHLVNRRQLILVGTLCGEMTAFTQSTDERLSSGFGRIVHLLLLWLGLESSGLFQSS